MLSGKSFLTERTTSRSGSGGADGSGGREYSDDRLVCVVRRDDWGDDWADDDGDGDEDVSSLSGILDIFTNDQSKKQSVWRTNAWLS